MIRSLIQPSSGRVREALEELATAANGGSCRILTAWLTPDGLSLANDLLVRHDVALHEIVVGINRGGTSARDLQVALDLLACTGGSLRYYLDGKLAGPIYHPKVWLMESQSFRGALVGSANLTREGLLNNVEAAIVLTDGGVDGRNEASEALDDLKFQIDFLSNSRHSVLVDASVISHLTGVGAIPLSAQRDRRDDADDGDSETVNADDLLNVPEPRVRSFFRPTTPLPKVTSGKAEGASLGSISMLTGTRIRYIRYYGRSEANRVRKYHEQIRELGRASAGTFEVNLTMSTPAEERFWGYPNRFILNQARNAREWSPRVRIVTIRDGNSIVTTVPSARLWTRIRGDRQSEVRFRFTNAAAVRDAFPRDIEERSLFIVDRIGDSIDFEVRLLGRNDPGYTALRPVDGDYEYRVI